jgi:hypothetical protein
VVGQEEGEDDTWVERSAETMVAIDSIRCIYQRKPDDRGRPRIGTRLTFNNSAGMAVTEPFETVAALLRPM